MAEKKSLSIEKLTPILVIVSIILAFAVGVLWQKVKSLEGGKSGTTSAGTATGDSIETQQAPQAVEGPTLGKISAEQASKIAEVTSDDHIRGNSDAPVTIIEYSDFACPYCGRFHATAKQVIDNYANQVRWVYRHFSYRGQEQADSTAIASECIADLGGQGAFWQFTDIVFDEESQVDDLVTAASQIGVNTSAFSECLESGKFASVVEEDYQSGIAAGVTGTPGNFILNESGDVWFIPGAYPYDQIKAYIDEALQ